MTDCEEFAIIGVNVEVKSAPHCSRCDAESDCLDQILTKCEQARKQHDQPMCSSGKDCPDGKKCIEYVIQPTPAKLNTVASRDPNCKEHRVHYVSSYVGLAECGCHCEELVPAGK
jgi:hypothetical protein